MRWFRLRGIRRLLALPIVLGLLLSSGESGVADVHDGDAPAEALAGPGVAEHVTHALDLSLALRDAPEPAPEAPSHDLHVCHCVHTHAGFMVTNRVSPDLTGLVLAVPVPRAEQRPTSADTEPVTPPPIA